MNKKINALDIAIFILSAVLLVGVLTAFGPCAPKEDGSWMTCHWAGQAVAGVAAVLTVISLMRFFVKDAKAQLGLDLAMLPASLLALLLPGKLIGLCMMADMRCRSVMTPAVTVLSILIIIAAVTDIILQRKKG